MFSRYLIIVGIALISLAGCHKGSAIDSTRLDPKSLAGMRLSHPTKLLLPGQAPTAPVAAIGDPEQVTYLSEGQSLGGWLLHPKKNEGRKPAVLLCHSGFALAQTDFDIAQTFAAAGFRVFLPTWRGERGNPGRFEMLYGEINDAAAAANYLANRPDVDAGRIYAAGFQHGATLVTLLAETPSRIRRAAAFEPTLDIASIIERDRKAPWPETPFDWRNPIETDLRSPSRHIADLQAPLRLYVADPESPAAAAARDFAAEATKRNKKVDWEAATDAKVSPQESVLHQMIILFEWH